VALLRDTGEALLLKDPLATEAAAFATARELESLGCRARPRGTEPDADTDILSDQAGSVSLPLKEPTGSSVAGDIGANAETDSGALSGPTDGSGGRETENLGGGGARDRLPTAFGLKAIRSDCSASSSCFCACSDGTGGASTRLDRRLLVLEARPTTALRGFRDAGTLPNAAALEGPTTGLAVPVLARDLPS
jgi:hypothetical protein